MGGDEHESLMARLLACPSMQVAAMKKSLSTCFKEHVKPLAPQRALEWRLTVPFCGIASDRSATSYHLARIGSRKTLSWAIALSICGTSVSN
ncbi:hypothetical protein EVAR_79674_1 [Eumeta japonica]|uniref:Uncharacterized protein n=1 Tax=Eumeta variegata TaxID=151549 RepID=A0A4C1WCH5_EUMVA|nr:hypothetical protein EVAR_79674_1 [Eumeta japonica]